jgi:hypothetical protein
MNGGCETVAGVPTCCFGEEICEADPNAEVGLVGHASLSFDF